MLVSGSGDIKLTKDGTVLLNEMQIQHPTASLIARVATAQDDITGDGTTSCVMLIGELLKQAENYVSEGLHPRHLTEGFDAARTTCLEVLNSLKISNVERDTLVSVARTSLRTKLAPRLADLFTEVVTDAVLAVRENSESTEVDLHRVEMMEMQHRNAVDTRLVRGLVMDHGGRHPDMPKSVERAFVLVANVSLEYEKTEVNSGFFYKSAEERDKFVQSERAFIRDRVQKVIELKRKVCDAAGPDGDKPKGFVLVNQKGIDPESLTLLAREGILALRRAKRRNMERLSLACGGQAVNSFDDMSADVLGYAGSIYEYVLGEEKFTFVEDCRDPRSVTLLLRGPNKFTLTQLRDAARDGLRAVSNALLDGGVVPGAGAFELAANRALQKTAGEQKGCSRLGVLAFAEALLVVPKVLAQNAGHDPQDVLVRLQEEAEASGGASVTPETAVGLDLSSGQACRPTEMGIHDNIAVKRQMINSCAVIAGNLLLVDEIMRAGLSSLKGGGQ